MLWLAVAFLAYGQAGLIQECSRGDEVRVTCPDQGLHDVAARLVHVAGIDEYHVQFLDRAVQVEQCPDRESFETHPNCIFTNEEVRRAACEECESTGLPCAVENTEPVYTRREEPEPVEQAWIPGAASMALA